MIKYSFPLKYRGNVLFPIIFLIVWLPVGLLMLLKNCYFVKGGDRFHIRYSGSWMWLYFWGFLFFPIAILLLVFNDLDIIEERFF